MAHIENVKAGDEVTLGYRRNFRTKERYLTASVISVGEVLEVQTENGVFVRLNKPWDDRRYRLRLVGVR